MTFTKYSPKRKRSTKPIISVSLQGFQLNRKSQELFKGKDFVELYYDTKMKIIGMKPLEKETSDSIRVRKYPDRSICVISATGFLSEFNLGRFLSLEKGKNDLRAAKKSIKIEAHWNSKDKMVILNLMSNMRKKFSDDDKQNMMKAWNS